MKDHFKTLGVEPTSTNDEIKKAYKKLAMQHHPDRGGDQNKFQEIQQAYDTLSDPQKRAQWEQEKHFGGGGADPSGFNFNFGFGGGDINDIFRHFGGGGNPFGAFRPVKNRDLRMGIEIDLESTLAEQVHHINVTHTNGAVKTVEVKIPRGVQTGMQMRFGGAGDHANAALQPGDLYIEFRIKPHRDFQINGIHLSKIAKMNCIDAMLGSKIAVTGLDGKQFEINVPPATQHGSKFRITSQGLWDVNHPTRGDLFIEVALQVPTSLTDDQLSRLQQLKF